jgi:DNA-binding transcriptional LysR family regulator
MELAQIRYFLAVCETRHFTRAAAVCGDSQPSLSAAIKRPERECGGVLFERGPPVALTVRGKVVRRHFPAISREVDKVRRLTRRPGGPSAASGPIRARRLDRAPRREMMLLV